MASVSPQRDVNGRKAARDDHDEQAFEIRTAPVVQIPVHNGPISGIATSSDGGRLMVTNYGRDSVSVVDTDTCRVVATVADVDEPFAIAAGPAATDRAYVSTVSTAYDAIDVIDLSTNAVIASHPLALSVSDLAVSPDGKYVYASRNGVRAADVAVLDTTTGQVLDVAETSRAPGITTECVRVSPDGDRVYVGTNGPSGGQVVVIETRAPSGRDGRARWRRKKGPGRSGTPCGRTALSVVDTIEIGAAVRDVALSPDGAVAYVASCGPDLGALVDVIDTRTKEVTATCKVGEVGGLLTGLTLSADGDRAYLVSHDCITVLCTLTHDVIGTVRVAKRPSCVVESPDGQYLYVADYSGTVTVAPVASTMAPGIEWTVPELPRREAALV
ncbi:hypothetical protein MLAC_06150 [Mycobacterium lacus]|uniref:YVTN family beta-propeller repeat protein n=1 Tax=Mycobacterium lacus TaxID=169765 RepID=A0A7I7NI39_9MYCO|nr:hypothetical protein MLAC_06150 [Mycobacterium lacus]